MLTNQQDKMEREREKEMVKDDIWLQTKQHFAE